MIKFGLAAVTDGKINPMLANSLGNVGAIGTGILARHIADHQLTGQWESWSDSAVNGTAAALLPIGFKYTAEFMGSNRPLSSILNYRTSAITGESVLARAAASETTGAQMAEMLKGTGLTKEIAQLEALGPKPISAMTADETAGLTKALNAQAGRPAAALAKVLPGLERSAADAGIVRALDNSGVKTVGDLEHKLVETQDRIWNLNEDVTGSAIKGLKDTTPVEEALAKTTRGTGAAAKPAFASKEALDEEVNFLKKNNIKTVGDLRAMSQDEAFSLEKMYPKLVGMAPGTTLREAAAATGNIFGADAQALGRVQLRNPYVPANVLGPEVSPRALRLVGRMGNWVDGLPGKGKDLVWDNRFYRVSVDGSPITFPGFKPPVAPAVGAAETDAVQAGSLRSTIGNAHDPARLKPELRNPILNAQPSAPRSRLCPPQSNSGICRQSNQVLYCCRCFAGGSWSL